MKCGINVCQFSIYYLSYKSLVNDATDTYNIGVKSKLL